jgi:hypothetical protein
MSQQNPTPEERNQARWDQMQRRIEASPAGKAPIHAMLMQVGIAKRLMVAGHRLTEDQCTSLAETCRAADVWLGRAVGGELGDAIEFLSREEAAVVLFALRNRGSK